MIVPDYFADWEIQTSPERIDETLITLRRLAYHNLPWSSRAALAAHLLNDLSDQVEELPVSEAPLDVDIETLSRALHRLSDSRFSRCVRLDDEHQLHFGVIDTEAHQKQRVDPTHSNPEKK